LCESVKAKVMDDWECEGVSLFVVHQYENHKYVMEIIVSYTFSGRN
jgi:hypothetical protein